MVFDWRKLFTALAHLHNRVARSGQSIKNKGFKFDSIPKYGFQAPVKRHHLLMSQVQLQGITGARFSKVQIK
jgi:hypothetical protein